MSRLAVVAAALLAFAAVLLLPDRAAQAQSATTVWSATLTVRDTSDYVGCSQSSNVPAASRCSSTTTLTDNDFTYDGTNYTLNFLAWQSSSDTALLGFIGKTGTTAKTALNGLTLNLGSSALAIKDANTASTALRWPIDLDWSIGDTVSVSLTAPPADNTRPAKPTGFNATPGNQRAILSWTDPSDSTITKWQYRQKTTGAYGSWQDFTSSAATTTHTVTSLTNGTAYTFQIRAVDGGGNGAASDEKTVTPAVQARGVTLSKTALTVAEGGTATYTIRLNTLPTFGSHGYIRVSFTSGDTSAVTLSGPGGSSRVTFRNNNWHIPQTVTVTGVEDADSVSETVTITHGLLGTTGSNYDGVSVPSVTVTVTDNETPATKPAKPAGLTATAGNQQVALGWTNPGDSSITKYQYQQKAGTAAWGSWTDIANSAPGETNATSYTVSSLANGTAYRFRIRAVNAAGNSPQSDVAGPVTPAASLPDAASFTADPSGWFKKGDTVSFAIRVTIPSSTPFLSPMSFDLYRYGGANCTGGVSSNPGNGTLTGVTTDGTQQTLNVNIPLNTGTVATFSSNFCVEIGNQGNSWQKKFPLTNFRIDHTKPTITFPSGVTPRVGQSYTISLADAHSKLKKYGAIAVASSATDATGCDTAAEVGSANLTTETTALATKSFAWTVAGSVGQKVCVYAEDAAGNIHSALGGTAIAAAPPAAPTVSGAPAITSSVPSGQDGKYKIGDDIAATLTFNSAIAVTGTPKLEITVGSAAKSADCAVNSSDNTKLVCTYAVASGDADADGIAIGSNKLSTPSMSAIKDSTGTTAATLTHSALTTQSSHKVDGVAPTISSYAISTTPTSGGTYASGQNIAVRVTFSEAVTLAGGNPSLKLQVGSSEKTAGYNSSPSTAVVEFLYTVENGDADANGVSVGANKLTLPSGGTIKDAAGNNADLASTGMAAQSGHKVDTTAPSAPSTLTAASGNARVILSWSNPNDATIAKYQYRQKAGTGNYGSWQDFASNASTVSHTVISLNNGTAYSFKVRAVDAAGNLGAESAEASATPVAPTGPTVTGSPAITSSVPSGQDGKYKIGDDIEATVTFGAAIAVSGTPKLEITVGSAAKSADCAAHSSDNTKLVCTYTVASGDEDTNGIAIGTNKLTTPSSATIKNTGGTADANLNHSALAQQSSHKVDGVRPTITTGLTVASAGPYAQGGSILIDAQFGEIIGVTGSPTLTIDVGGSDRTATFVSTLQVSNTAVRFRYQVQSGDEDTDGISIGANKVTVPTGAAIKDAAGNAATVTHSALPTQSAHKVDAVVPVAPTNFTATAGNMQVTLSWSDPGDDSIHNYGYRQKAGTGSYGSWMSIPNSDKDTTSHTVTSLANGTLYTFQVRASDDGGNKFGPASAEATATPTTVPAIGGLTAVPGPTQVTLSWTNPASCTAVSPVCGYQYRYRPAGGAWTSWAFLTTPSLTTHTVTGLNNGTRYEFEVRRRQTGNTLAQSAVSATPAATVPAIAGLTAVAGPEKVTLSWPNPASCTAHAPPVCKYRTRYRPSGGAWSIWRETVGPRVFGALTAGTEYEFQVRRWEPGTILAQSTVKATPLPGVVVAALAAPEGLFGNPHRDTDSITLNWRRPAAPADAPVTGYELQVSESAAGPWTVLATITDSTASASHTHGNVGAGTTRWYRVRAVNSAGEGPWSGVVSASTYAANAPAAPTGVAAVGISGGVRLSWDATTDSTVTGWEYHRWQGAVWGPWTAVPGGAATVRHDVTGLQPGMRHSFQIRAVAGIVNGKWSAAVGAEPNMRPTGLVAEPGPGSVTLSWDDPGDDAITGWEYQQRVRQLAWGPWTAVPGGAGTTSFTVRGLIGDSYDYRVRAVYPGGVRGPESAQATARAEAVRKGAPTDVPGGLRAVAGNARVLLVWDNPSRRRMAYWEHRTKAGNGSWSAWRRFGPTVEEEDGHIVPDPSYYTVESLTNGTAHSFQVRAVNSAGPGPGSAVVRATPLAIDPVVVTPGADRLKVDWAGAAMRAWGYTVEWRSGSESYGAPERTLRLHGQVTDTVITGLAPGTEYGVRVSYWDVQHGTSRTLPIIPPDTTTGGGQNSVYPTGEGNPYVPNYDNTEVRATTLGPAAALARVEGMRATSADRGIAVGWNPVLGADGYVMEWRATEQAYEASRRETYSGEAATAGSVFGLSPGTEYTVRVTATREGAPQGAPSEEVSARAMGVTVSPGPNALRVAWTAEPRATGHALAGYTLEWAPATEDYGEARRLQVGADTTGYEFPGLDGGVEYKVRVSWRPGADGGSVRTIGEARGTPAGEAGVSPRLTGATVRGDTLALSYDGALDADPAPYKPAFAVRDANALLDVVDVSVAGSEVRLGLAGPVGADDTVTVSYTPPARADGRIRSAAGAAAAGFSNLAVTNETPGALPAVSAADAEAAGEGASLAFAVTLDAAASGPVTVDWTTSDGTAVAGEDYTAATGTLSFAAGETAKTVTVVTLGDTAAEETETLTLTLSNPSGAVLGDAQASGSITDVALQRGSEPLTAAFTDAPSEHGGKGEAFTVRVAFSAPVTVGATRAVREGTLGVEGARVVRSTRVEGRKDLWELRIKPGSHDAVTLTLAAAADCAAAGAVCTKDGRRLETAPTATVQGPPSLSVADARGREGRDAALGFAVTLSRAASGPVTVDYATRDGTAVAGEDYTAASGTLTFAAGETAKTVSVAILDDAHDEGRERFTLRLSNAVGAWIADGKAVGTIRNSDPMPQAWIARFGRTVTGQVLDMVAARLEAPRAAGAQASLAGQALPSWAPSGSGAGGDTAANDNAANDNAPDAASLRAGAEDRAGLAAMGRWLAQVGPDSGSGSGAAGRETAGFGPQRDGALRHETRALTGRDLLTGTSFALTGGTAEGGGGSAALWGRGAITSFDGREGDLTLDGEVTTGLIGADWATERWTAGLGVGHSRGTGGYRSPAGGGKVEATLTGVYPYAGMDLTQRVSAWAAAGYGSGGLELTPEGRKTLKADLSMAMGAVGARGKVLEPVDGDGLALAVKGDARFTRTSSDAGKDASGGKLKAADADVWLLRAGIEGSRRFALGSGGDGGATLTPSFELGGRLDGGDAEKGLGADIGGGLAFADPKSGLTLDLKARGLLAHEASGFREWGASASVAWDPRPSTDRGLSLSLRQSWGAAPAGGMDALLSRETLAGLAANDDGAAPFEAASRLEGEVGYGIVLFDGAFTGTPNIGFGLSDTGRDWRLGWRLTSAVPGDPGFEVNLDATRSESAGAAPGHGVMLRGTVRW